MIEQPSDVLSDEDAAAFGTPPVAELGQPIKKPFRPWHHPRKQYVRIHQWCHEIVKLIDELKLPAGTPFRYFSLPGDELLDVRVLHGVCDRHRVSLRYLGFNDIARRHEARIESNLSRNEVSALKFIDPHSHVAEDRLESLSSPTGRSAKSVLQQGPYHAINLDLCDSIAMRDADHPGGSTLGALTTLLELQTKTSEPWVLFVTTLAQRAAISERNRQGFQSAIDANIGASGEFKEELAQLLKCSVESLDARLQDAWQGDGDRYIPVFATGFGKWLLSVLARTPGARELQLLSCVYYQVGPDGPDMVSLAFRCHSPVAALADPHGIIAAASPPQTLSEVDLAIRLARGIGAAENVDHLLKTRDGLAERLIQQSSRLLSQARYSADEYIEWAMAELDRNRGPHLAADATTAQAAA